MRTPYNSNSNSSLTMKKHVHLIGICGTGMGSLAGLFLEAGYQVSGSDTAFYPPMGEQLRALSIELKTGFSQANLDSKPDLVIVGNVCTKENEEVQAAIRLKIPYFSLPAALQEFFLKEKKTLVVSGTHGKTTTATLLAWVLENAGLKPGFFVGGVGLNLKKSYQLGEGDYFVVEGDEYDSAFFDKTPKFRHFQPLGAILTSLEWDHVDIYPTFDDLLKAFRYFFENLGSDSTLLAINGNESINRFSESPSFNLKRYGLLAGNYRLTNVTHSPEGQKATLHFGKETVAIETPLSGKANLENCLAVIGLCHQLGFDWKTIQSGLSSFGGVKRRQEIKGIVKEVTVIDDFAHHPTAVSRTIAALKEKFPGQKLIVVFEPRSNTSRRNTHYNEYLRAFDKADRALLAYPKPHPKIPQSEMLQVETLADAMMSRGVDAYAINGSENILEFILRSIGPNEVVAFFSNGDFDNLPNQLLEKLKRRKITADRKGTRAIKVKNP